MQSSFHFLFLTFTATLAPARDRQSSPPPTALLSYLDVGVHRVVFADDSIVEAGVRKALVPTSVDVLTTILGSAPRSHRGDAGESLSWTCYRLAGTPHMSLLLESDEMSAGDLGGFELIPTGTRASMERGCVPLDVRATDVRTNRGIRLGLTRTQVTHLLGVPGRDSANAVIFEKVTRKRGLDAAKQPIVYDESSYFTLVFRGGKVIRIEAWRVDAS